MKRGLAYLLAREEGEGKTVNLFKVHDKESRKMRTSKCMYYFYWVVRCVRKANGCQEGRNIFRSSFWIYNGNVARVISNRDSRISPALSYERRNLHDIIIEIELEMAYILIPVLSGDTAIA